MADDIPLIMLVDGLAWSGDRDMVRLVKMGVQMESFEARWKTVSPTRILNAAADWDPALIIAGHRPLPGMPDNLWGADVILALKEDPATQHIPVVLLESIDDIQRIARACGADATLSLPLSPHTLVITLRQLIAGK
jgi:CheY-like chemotaxis protein